LPAEVRKGGKRTRGRGGEDLGGSHALSVGQKKRQERHSKQCDVSNSLVQKTVPGGGFVMGIK